LAGMPLPAIMYRLTLTAAASGLLLGCLVGCDRKVKDTDIKIVSVSDVKLMVDRGQRNPAEVLLVDPRPAKYYEQGHVPGARNIQLPQIDPKDSLDPGISRYNAIVVYGDDPGSAVARAMTKRLLAAGYDGVRFFAGGVKEWAKRYPLEPARPPVQPEVTPPAAARPDASAAPAEPAPMAAEGPK
jgi:3-mercaptopyruvate sulfurtransferase SseA